MLIMTLVIVIIASLNTFGKVSVTLAVNKKVKGRESNIGTIPCQTLCILLSKVV